jgi:CRISPR/Cas system Type II protein with McrA/HNH and RuvC-like nuclease domain
MGESWEGIHLPDQKVKYLEELIEQEKITPDSAIEALIGSQQPLIQHRMRCILKRVKALCQTSKDLTGQEIDRIVIEMPREKSMDDNPKSAGDKEKKKAKEYIAESSRLEKEWLRMADLCRKYKMPVTYSNMLRCDLFEKQKYLCVYTGRKLEIEDLKSGELQIEHIVPRSQRGPDSPKNFVITHSSTNAFKNAKTPYETWGQNTNQWNTIQAIVKTTNLHEDTQKLILSPNAKALAQKMSKKELGGTAYITKYVKLMLCIYFGVPMQNQSKVVTTYGGKTFFRRLAIHQELTRKKLPTDFLGEADGKPKDRKDKRHHAIDALFCTFWNYETNTMLSFSAPWFIQVATKASVERLARAKPKFEETCYGERNGRPVVRQPVLK